MNTQVRPAEEGVEKRKGGWKPDLYLLCLNVCCPYPDYVPLLRRAYELWHDLEAEADQVAPILERIRLNTKAFFKSMRGT